MINNSIFQEAKELTEKKLQFQIFRHFNSEQFRRSDFSQNHKKNDSTASERKKINAANLERGTHSVHRSSSHLQTPFTSYIMTHNKVSFMSRPSKVVTSGPDGRSGRPDWLTVNESLITRGIDKAEICIFIKMISCCILTSTLLKEQINTVPCIFTTN